MRLLGRHLRGQDHDVARRALRDEITQPRGIERDVRIVNADHQQIGGIERRMGLLGRADLQAQRGMREHLRKPGAQQRMILQQNSLHGFLVSFMKRSGRARMQKEAPHTRGMRPSNNPGVRLGECACRRSRTMGARGAGPSIAGAAYVEGLRPASGTDCRASAG